MCAEFRAAAVLLLLALASVPAVSYDMRISQDLDASAEETCSLYGVRKDNPLNDENFQERPSVEQLFTGEARWLARFGRRVSVLADGIMDWTQYSGTAGGTGPEQGETDLRLHELLFTLDISEAFLKFRLGKTCFSWGPAVLFPVVDYIKDGLLEEDSQYDGKWLAGFSFQKGFAGFDAVFSPGSSFLKRTLHLHEAYSPHSQDSADWFALARAGCTLGVHRFGLLYNFNGSSRFGAYYSGQTGDEWVPYAECSFSNRSQLRGDALRSFAGKDDGFSFDGLVGAHYTSSFANLSVFAEYRFKSSGLSGSDCTAVRQNAQRLKQYSPGMYYEESGLLCGYFPYMASPVHTAGVRLQNASPVADCIDCGVNVFYLAPKGLYVEAQGDITVIERLKLSMNGRMLLSPEDGSELNFHGNLWEMRLSCQWTVHAAE